MEYAVHLLLRKYQPSSMRCAKMNVSLNIFKVIKLQCFRGEKSHLLGVKWQCFLSVNILLAGTNKKEHARKVKKDLKTLQKY